MVFLIYFAYISITLVATILGAISGMGGGGIMKPIFDAFGWHNATDIATITMFSTLVMTVFSLTITIIFLKERKIDYKLFLFISIGAIGGGLTGKFLFKLLTNNDNDYITKIVQNAVFAFLIILTIVYLFNSKKIKSLNLKNPLFGLPVGIVLGLISGFLSIGGGQFNVPVTMFFFGFDVKLAVLSSLTIILFSQTSNIIAMLINTGGSGVVLKSYPYVLLCVVLTALVGAIIGRLLAKKINLKNTKYFCVGVDSIIFCLCIYNIINLSLKLVSSR